MDKQPGISGAVSAALGKAVELMLSVVRPESSTEFEKDLRDLVTKGKGSKARSKALAKAGDLADDGQPLAAAELLERALSIIPTDDDVLLVLVDLLLRTPDAWGRARPVLAELRRRGSRSDLLQLELSLADTAVRYGGHRYQTLRTFVERIPKCKYPVVLKLLAWSSVTEDPRASALFLEQALALDPDDAEAHAALAHVHRRLGEEAYAQIEETIIRVIRG